MLPLFNITTEITDGALNTLMREDHPYSHGLQVDISEDVKGIALHETSRRERPTLDPENWRGLAEVRRKDPGADS